MLLPRDPNNSDTISLLDQNELTCFGAVPEPLQTSFVMSTISEQKVKKIVCGNSHCLILLNDGLLYGFGGNEEGQLGLKVDNAESRYISEIKPISIVLPEIPRYEIKDIAAGDNYSLILVTSQGKDFIVKFCLDKKDKYRIKQNDLTNVRIDPIPDSVEDIYSIYAFGQRKMFIAQNNRIFVGGIDFKNNDLEGYVELAKLDKIHITSFHLGMNHCIFLASDGNLYGLGDNTYGELGPDQMSCTEFREIKTNLKGKIKEISSGARHVLILLENGELFCMGDNSEGQGYSYAVRLNVPTKIELDINDTVEHCYCGNTHNLIVLKSGTVMTWGDSFSGKLGHGDEFFSQPTPQVVLSLKQKEIYNVGLGFQMSVIATGRH